MIREVHQERIATHRRNPAGRNDLVHNRELIFSFVAIFLVTGLYTFVVVWLGSIPRASDFFGHSLGVVGFTMMIMTETLYTFRKRSRNARWGRMSIWLQFHIFTGIVGPYLVLLHTSWKFNGLAGVLMLLTAITVLSGFIGRYIYTALPRNSGASSLSLQDSNISTAELELQIEQILSQRWQSYPLPPGSRRRKTPSSSPALMIFGRSIEDLVFRIQWTQYRSKLPPEAQVIASRLQSLVIQQREMHREQVTAAMARKLMALWHTIHIPIGMALFALAAVHIVAAIYYATLLQ